VLRTPCSLTRCILWPILTQSTSGPCRNIRKARKACPRQASCLCTRRVAKISWIPQLRHSTTTHPQSIQTPAAQRSASRTAACIRDRSMWGDRASRAMEAAGR
jgi:hypothetical protein